MVGENGQAFQVSAMTTNVSTVQRLPLVADDHARQDHDGRSLGRCSDARCLTYLFLVVLCRVNLVDVLDGVDVVVIVGLRSAAPTLTGRRHCGRRVYVREDRRDGGGPQHATLHANLEVGRPEVERAHDGPCVGQKSRSFFRVPFGDRVHPGVPTSPIRWYFVKGNGAAATPLRRRT